MNSEPIDPMWADLPLEYDMGIEEYKPVPWSLLIALGYLSWAFIIGFGVAAYHYWGKP